jgi:hypothetical protein
LKIDEEIPHFKIAFSMARTPAIADIALTWWAGLGLNPVLPLKISQRQTLLPGRHPTSGILASCFCNMKLPDSCRMIGLAAWLA